MIKIDYEKIKADINKLMSECKIGERSDWAFRVENDEVIFCGENLPNRTFYDYNNLKHMGKFKIRVSITEGFYMYGKKENLTKEQLKEMFEEIYEKIFNIG